MLLTLVDDRGAIQKEIENLNLNEFQFSPNDFQTPPLHLLLQAP